MAGFSLVTVVASPLDSAHQTVVPRIVGGFPALETSTRHQVSIRHRTEPVFGSGHICGGSLINNRTVLTAAHCLVDTLDRKRPASFFQIVGGNVNRYEQTQNTVVRTVANVVVHQRYNPKNFDNDVGLLILSEPVPDGHPTLKPIEMATKSPKALTTCQTSGWGTSQYGVSYGSRELRAVNVTVQQVALCNGPNSYYGTVRPGILCAGDFRGGRDACQGDSGGPLLCPYPNEKDRWFVGGIVSWGVRCANPKLPGVYANVPKFIPWILAQINNHSTLQTTTIGR